MRYDRLGAEALGTLMLVSLVGIAKTSTDQLAPFIVPGTLLSAMAITGFVSGAMFNPSVTTGSLVFSALQKSLSRQQFFEHICFFVIQFVAGILGAFVSWGLVSSVSAFNVSDSYNAYQAFVGELLWSFLLVGTALAVGNWEESKLKAGSAVCTVILSGSIGLGGISGAGFNPAVVLPINLIAYIDGKGKDLNLAVYLLAPMLAGVLAGVYSHIQLSVKEKTVKKVYKKSNDVTEVRFHE